MRSMKCTTTITKPLKRQHGTSLCTDHRRWGRRWGRRWCCPRRRRRRSRRLRPPPLPPSLPPIPTFKKRRTARSCPRAGRRFGMTSSKDTTTTTKKLESQNGRGLCTDRRRWGRRWCCPRPRRLPVMSDQGRRRHRRRPRPRPHPHPHPPPLPPMRSCPWAGRRFGMRSMKGTTTITKLLKRQHGTSLCTDLRRCCRRWCRRCCRRRQDQQEQRQQEQRRRQQRRQDQLRQ
jgi:hypothetical protein